MVMEAPPSPQCVGREFVRQYYTLLNQAPTHLHRFYNNQSSFVHGGLDPPNRETTPMIGQKQIHQKIQQLNFQDCHAKITQVDSQATLGNGVVVQVTGELSNAGQPMRRFTQTFVLAAQSPKKYYVHNDIFRYQDEVYTDEECDPEPGRAEVEEEIVPNQNIQEAPQPLPQQPMYYNPNPVNATPMQAPNMTVPHHPPQMPPVMPATPAVASVNGAVHPEDILPPVIPGTVGTQPHLAGQGLQASHTPLGIPQTIPTAQPLPAAVLAPEEEPPKMPEPQPELEPTPEENFAEEKSPEKDEPIPVEEVPQQEPIISNEPKTYATLVKSGGSSGQASFASAMTMNQNQTSKPTSSPPPLNRMDNRDQSGLSGMPPGPPLGQRNNLSRGARQNNTGNRNMPRQDSRGQNRTSFNDDGEDRRRSAGGNTGNSHYSDAYQLFMGNLPHNATEDDLRQIFGQFGTIAELRIHSKPVSKGVPGRAPPNYGFVTFEDQQSVQMCLQSASMLTFPPNSEHGQKLNVEEKKTRVRQPMDGGRMNSGGDNGGMGRPNSGLGTRTGGSNMMRGGPGGMGHRGHPRGGGANFQRNDNRNQNMTRGTNNYGNRR